jgi:PhnB protein
MPLNSYLTFDGQCEDAFKFYEECLGGKIVGLWRRAGTPVESQGTSRVAQQSYPRHIGCRR